MDELQAAALAQLLQQQGGMPQRGGLSEMMRANFAARGTGPIMENNHAAPPVMPQRPGSNTIEQQVAAQISPISAGAGMGLAAGDMQAALKAGDLRGAASAGAPMAMALIPGLRGRMGAWLRSRMGGKPAPIDAAADPVGAYARAVEDGRIAPVDPTAVRAANRAAYDAEQQAMASGRGGPASAPTGNLVPPEAMPASSVAAPAEAAAMPEPVAQQSGQASYPALGTPARENIRDAYRIAVTEAGKVPPVGPTGRAIQDNFADMQPPLPNLSGRLKETNKQVEAFTAANGRPPTTKADWDSVYKDTRTLGLAGMLSAGAAAGSSPDTSPAVHPDYPDRDVSGRWIAVR